MKDLLTGAVVGCALSIAAFCAAAGDFEDAVAAHKKGDYATALRLLTPLAEQGNADAQYKLGGMYEQGQGVTKDEAEAVKWYRKAAEQNDAEAQCNLGLAYATGQGVARDEAEAVKWFRKAAEQNDALAQNNLGSMYARGQGVIKDPVQAHAWFTVARANGYEDAQKALARNEKGMTSKQKTEAAKLARELLKKTNRR